MSVLHQGLDIGKIACNKTIGTVRKGTGLKQKYQVAGRRICGARRPNDEDQTTSKKHRRGTFDLASAVIPSTSDESASDGARGSESRTNNVEDRPMHIMSRGGGVRQRKVSLMGV